MMDYVETQWQIMTMKSKAISNVDDMVGDKMSYVDFNVTGHHNGHIAQVGGGSERLRKEIEGEIAERLREMRTIARKK